MQNYLDFFLSSYMNRLCIPSANCPFSASLLTLKFLNYCPGRHMGFQVNIFSVIFTAEEISLFMGSVNREVDS